MRLSFSKAKTPLFGPAREPAGKVPLGATRRGKPVYASGAESGGYDDQDHYDAARFHAQAHVYHDARTEGHREAGDGDENWRRSEQHHGESARHGKLAEHHMGLVRHHMVAGGHADEAELDAHRGQPRVKNFRPMGAKAREASKKHLAGRTHHDHPGGVTESDKAAYGKFTAEGKRPDDDDD